MSKMHDLVGQSIWFDNISREILVSGELGQLVADGLKGLTSNPAIFEKAISSGSIYDQTIAELKAQGLSALEIYETLAVDDIRQAADVLAPVYGATDGQDGYVSLEVNPHLAHDAAGTVAEARRLHAAVGRPNLMIKVPATPAGIEAISELIAAGINVNVTLLFAVDQYRAAAEAYIKGLEQRKAAGQPLEKLASVASLFISRLDAALDPEFDRLNRGDLRGHIAIDNARLAYGVFEELFGGSRWAALAGARPQRLLWASTGVKDKLYSDVKYIDELIWPQTVNTVPPATLTAWCEHGATAGALPELAPAEKRVVELAQLEIDFAAVTAKLLADGLKAFEVSFDQLLGSIAAK